MKTTSRWGWLFGMALACLHAGCGGGGMVNDDAGVPTCTNHANCDDDLFCTGVERCMPSHPDALANGCVLADSPCGTASCVEEEERCESTCADDDNDGHTDADCGGDDCDDDDNLRFPGNTEVCDAGGHDEDCDPCTVGSTDEDEDLFIDDACRNTVPVGSTPSCGISVRYDASTTSIRGLDCDDDAEMIKPGQAETCNQVDDDCDDDTDEDLTLQPFWPDVDMDLAGDESATPTFACSRPEGTADNDADCDDSRNDVLPLGTELCDGRDNDCDGETDEQSATYTYYLDQDGDGVGTSAQPQTTDTCEPPTGYSAIAGDCVDTNELVYPGATELCDRLDNNCSQVVSPGGVAVDEDVDDDGHAPTGATCDSAAANTLPADDCDDTRALVHTGASEYCSGTDEDCDGETDETGADVCAPGDSCGMGCVANAAIAVGWTEACAVLADGGVACWGQSGMETITRVPGVTGARQIAAGRDHTCIRVADGTVRCWGDNTYGQLGAGHQSAVTGQVTPVGLGPVLAVHAGSYHTCALKQGGQVWCWGNNADGRLGIGSTSSTGTPTRLTTLSNVVEIALRSAGGCTRTADGFVDCWGTGPTGDGVNSFVTSPVRLPLTGVLDLSADELISGTCARRASGWVCWGDGAILGGTMTVQVPTALSPPGGAEQVAISARGACGLTDGEVQCWGESMSANFGVSAPPAGLVTPANAVEVPLTVMPTQIECGFDVCCGVAGDQVTCWGTPEGSRHGDGPRDGSIPNVPLGLTNVTDIAMGAGASCAIADGALRCWGGPDLAGFGDDRERFLPETLVGSGMAQVDILGSRACSRDTTGTLRCWGAGAAGDVAETTDSRAPVAVDQSVMGPATHVTVGGDGATQFSCALDGTGGAWCWGSGTAGVCGNGTNTCPTPVAVSGGLVFSTITAGPLHVCGVTVSNDVYCWGDAEGGQLGDGTTSGSVNTPVHVWGEMGNGFLTGITHVALMYNTTCARRSDGRVLCWGVGTGNELGNGNIGAALAPELVSNLTDAESLVCYGSGCFARRQDDTWVAWGNNFRRRLGVSSPASLPTPVAAAFGLELTDIALAFDTACGVDADGVPHCWGGANGTGNQRAYPLVTVVPLPD